MEAVVHLTIMTKDPSALAKSSTWETTVKQEQVSAKNSSLELFQSVYVCAYVAPVFTLANDKLLHTLNLFCL